MKLAPFEVKYFSSTYSVKKEKGCGGNCSWNKAISLERNPTASTNWRNIVKIIRHKNFQSEALSWKGYDLALVELSDKENSPLQGGPAVPICLSGADFADLEPGRNLMLAGFGRRYIAHCLTDAMGPETFETCGRPIACSRNHRTRHCGLEFLYDGKKWNRCIKDPTPSQADKECQSIRNSIGQEEKTVHIIEGGKYRKTCFKVKASNGAGWCTTRKPGVNKNSEPTPDSGWGFCSDAPNQKHCNEFVPNKQDTRPIELDVLSNEYCVDKLGDNLAVEQPNVEKGEYKDLLEKFLVFCTGKNYTRKFDKDLFVDENGESLESPGQKILSDIRAKLGGNLINGGPACFGDSGGPAYTVTRDGTPVQVGVFSFMLWGTCQGAAEPSYFVRVKEILDWIKLYVVDGLCVI